MAASAGSQLAAYQSRVASGSDNDLTQTFAQLVGVRLDHLKQLGVAGRAREFDPGLGHGVLQVGALLEAPVLVRMHQLEKINPWVQAMRGTHPGYFGIDELRLVPACDSHPMVAVDDEVQATCLDHRDGRHRPIREERANGVEPTPLVLAAGSKELVEVD